MEVGNNVVLQNDLLAFIDITMCTGYFFRTGTNLRISQILMPRSLKTGMRIWMVNGSLPWSPTQSTRYRLLLHFLEFVDSRCFMWLGYDLFELASDWCTFACVCHRHTTFATEPKRPGGGVFSFKPITHTTLCKTTLNTLINHETCSTSWPFGSQ